MITPHKWQEPAIAKQNLCLTTGEIAINASDTGTGKTICAGQSMKELKRDFLVIAPKAVHTNWRRTIDEMAISNQLLDVINAERLRFKNKWFINGNWCLPKGAQIVWDEIHRGSSGPRTETAKVLALTKAWHIPLLAMSATIADSPVKLRGLGYLLDLHKFNTSSFNRWCLDNGCFRIPGRDELQFPKGPKAQALMAKIHKQIADRLVRLRIADIEGFPETQLCATLFDLEEKYTEQINEIYNEMKAELKKECSDPMVARLRARQRTELLKVPLLVELALDAIAEDLAPVLFVNFRDTVEALDSALKASGQAFGIIIGEQKPTARQNFIDLFQANLLPGMIATADAGGVGINLHDIHHSRQRVSYITPSDNSVAMKQCLGRIHRDGGTKSVQTFVLIAGTAEEKVYANVRNKLGNIDALNGEDLAI